MAVLTEGINVLMKFGFYDTVFPFLLVVAVMFGMLSRYKPFGDNKTVNIVVSTVIGFFMIYLTSVVTFLKLLIPVLTSFLTILLLLMLVFLFMGVKEQNITDAILKEPAIPGILILLFVAIVLAVYSQATPGAQFFFQFPGLAKTSNYTLIPAGATAQQAQAILLRQQITNFLFSPVVFGLIALVAILGIAVYFITREPEKKGGG